MSSVFLNMNPIVPLGVLAGLAALILLARHRRRPEHGESGEDIGEVPESAPVAAPDSVELSGEIPDRPPPMEWRDMSERRRLPLTEYRPALDERETKPNEAPR